MERSDKHRYIGIKTTEIGCKLIKRRELRGRHLWPLRIANARVNVPGALSNCNERRRNLRSIRKEKG